MLFLPECFSFIGASQPEVGGRCSLPCGEAQALC
jgi:hypothetical protein